MQYKKTKFYEHEQACKEKSFLKKNYYHKFSSFHFFFILKSCYIENLLQLEMGVRIFLKLIILLYR